MPVAGRLAEWSPGFTIGASQMLGPVLSPWAVSVGIRYTGRPYYDDHYPIGSPPVAEIVYLAKSIRRRILHRIDHATE